MAFILKKVIKPWGSTKNARLAAPETPLAPPSPDLSHLTQEEITVIHDVIRRQEEFDRKEAGRVKKLKEELESLQEQLLTQRSSGDNQQRKLVDLRLCRLCFKTKFADGVGRVCYDCQQRVCPNCGAFSKHRWNARKNKSVRGRWRCKLCSVRREVLCRTGDWYHHSDTPAHGLGRKLSSSVTADQEAETDVGSSACQGTGTNTNVEDSENCPSGNRTDSELLCHITQPTLARTHNYAGKKTLRRRALPPEPGATDGRRGDKDNDDDEEEDDEDKDSLNSFILHRRMSRKRRQEKMQRRRLRAGHEQCQKVPTESSQPREGADGPIYEDGGGARQEPGAGRAAWGHSISYTSGLKSPAHDECKPENEYQDMSTTETSSLLSSYRESSSLSISDDGPGPASPSLVTLRITRQDAVSLGSSCVSITSTNTDSRQVLGGMSSLGSYDPLSARSRDSLTASRPDERKMSLAKGHDSLRVLGENSLAKWKEAGFRDSYMFSLYGLSTDQSRGIRVTGGVEDSDMVSKTLVTWVTPDLRSSVNLGHEVMEWNGESLRNKTFDQVTALTSSFLQQLYIILRRSTDRLDEVGVVDHPKISTRDRTLSQSPTGSQGREGKRRLLPKTPVEMGRAVNGIRGEVQLKVHYQPSQASVAVTVVRARHIGQLCHVGSAAASPFVIIALVPGNRGRDYMETELRTSNQPEWEQTFHMSGITLTELVTKTLQVTVWSSETGCDVFVGEVLLDLALAQLDNQAVWYPLEEHDENMCSVLRPRRSQSASISASLTSGSFRDVLAISPSASPEVPSQRHHRQSPSSVGSATMSPVPFVTSQVGSREFHLNSVSDPDSFSTKMRKKMRNTVSKMSSLTVVERKDNAASDESSQSEFPRRRLSDKSDKSHTPISRSPSTTKRRQNSHNSMDLLAPPQVPSRTNSIPSFFMSDEEDSQSWYSMASSTPDRPPPEGDDVTSLLGPGQIPPKPSAETSVCGDIKLGFMVSKGQLEVDICCAVGLHRSGKSQAPDTYVKTYLVEGRKVIQRKKTLVVKSSFDPIYRKTIKYSACNVHGRIMKINIWERARSFEKKTCRGEVLVKLDCLDLPKHTMAWYKLFELNATDYGSDEFLNAW